MAGEVIIWPKGFQLESLKFITSQHTFIMSFINTVYITVVGTFISMILTLFLAYPLSKKNLIGRNILFIYVLFTMLFSGGLIPTYILIKKLGMMNSLWSLMLPNAISPFYVIIMINFFKSLPDSMEESAKIDGASNFRILLSIMIPLSMPSIAALTLFYAVGRWNGFFDALIFIQSRNLYPLQLYLWMLLKSFQQSNLFNVGLLKQLSNRAPQTIQGAAVFVATVPILIVYPFLQRYFVKGVMIGAVKG